MHRLPCPPLLALLALLAVPATGSGQAGPAAPDCWVRGDRGDLELRASPFDSAMVELDGGTLKVCYSRPRKLGRPIMGRLVPFGEPWRLGADEATAIHIPARASIGDATVGPGWYTLYAIPGEERWRIVVNGSTERWGVPINDDVRAADVGTAGAAVEEAREVVELLTMRFEPTAPSAADLVIAWDRTVVRVPVRLHR